MEGDGPFREVALRDPRLERRTLRKGCLMSRKFGSVNVEIWNDPAFRALPPAAQHLYLLLWTAPNLSFCGVHDWRPGRLTHLSTGFTEDHTRIVANCLTAHHFLVIDEATEEVLVRSW